MDQSFSASSQIRGVPKGQEFLHLCWDHQDACQAKTDRRLPELGVKAPQCLTHLGTVLSLLDQLASCWWTCRGGDHHEEYLVGRAANMAHAALRLMRFGLYDEALALTRHAGEIANLLWLFAIDATARSEWCSADAVTQRRSFSPVKVRLRIEAAGDHPPIADGHYALLSDVAAHVNTRTTPEAHNVLGIPAVAAMFQEEGLIVTLNEIAIVAAATLAGAALLLVGDHARTIEMLESGRELAESIGGLTLTESRKRWAVVRESQEFRALLQQMRGAET